MPIFLISSRSGPRVFQVNPILYGLTNENFREGYRTILGLNQRNAVGDTTAKTGRRPSGVTYGHGMLPDSSVGVRGSIDQSAHLQHSQRNSVV